MAIHGVDWRTGKIETCNDWTLRSSDGGPEPSSGPKWSLHELVPLEVSPLRKHRPSPLFLTAVVLLLAASPIAAAGERRGDGKSTPERPRVVRIGAVAYAPSARDFQSEKTRTATPAVCRWANVPIALTRSSRDGSKLPAMPGLGGSPIAMQDVRARTALLTQGPACG